MVEIGRFDAAFQQCAAGRIVKKLQPLPGRAALGLSWIALPGTAGAAVAEIRRALAPAPCVMLDAPDEVRRQADVWGVGDSPAIDLMRRVKRRFDPAGACSPGVLVGGI